VTRHTQPAIQPSAERYFIFFCVWVFALYKRKNPDTDGKYHAAAGEKVFECGTAAQLI
jgi:hypothetical protein